MPKHEPLTPKAIANRIKAKGLQKLRWYCQMCQKQCRDQNGFKCHIMSESHQRQLLLFAESPGRYMYEFNHEFEKGYLDILRRQFGTKRVHANMVYQEYIKDRNHIHMNSTSWHTLTGFVNYLSRVGICKVDNTEKGWYIQYIDREEEQRRERLAKKQKMDKDDDEVMQEMVMRQAERAKQQLEEKQRPAEQTDDAEEVVEDEEESNKPREFKKEDEAQKIEFHFAKPILKKEPAKIPLKNEETKLALKRIKCEDRDDVSSVSSSSSRKEKPAKPSALDEIRRMEETRKETINRKDYWLHEGIVVKIVTKRLGDKYYKRKGVVETLVDKYTGQVRVLSASGELTEDCDLLKLDQSHLETVIPAVGKPVLIVNGAYRGLRALLESLDVDNFAVSVRIDESTTKGRVVQRVQYEDVCKVYKD